MRRVYICCRVMASLFRRGVMTHQKIHAPFLRFFHCLTLIHTLSDENLFLTHGFD